MTQKEKTNSVSRADIKMTRKKKLKKDLDEGEPPVISFNAVLNFTCSFNKLKKNFVVKTHQNQSYFRKIPFFSLAISSHLDSFKKASCWVEVFFWLFKLIYLLVKRE